MPSQSTFSYDEAFSRNLGWFTEGEQLALRGKTIAIAGMGGVGGVHLLTLARLGIGGFHIADFDRFDIVNFNRQVGAAVSTIGHLKAEVMDRMARDINPELRIRRFDDGVNDENLEAFLAGIDLFVDGLDFFVLAIRRKVMARCTELGIPTVIAAPLGLGTGYLTFVPGGMSFEQYFRFEGQNENEQYLRFLVGLSPRGLHRPYLVDNTRLNLDAHTAPSTGAGCQLCAGAAAAQAVKLLLRRGDVQPAPVHHHYDAYLGKLVTTRLRWGNAGPLQRLKLTVARRAIAGMIQRGSSARGSYASADFFPATPLEEILHAARWTPSGDNEQPWHFEITASESLILHLPPPDTSNPYHYRDGEPGIFAAGMLLESLRIAATAHGRTMEWHCLDNGKWPRIEVSFTEDNAVVPDRLYSYLGMRSVDRSRFRVRPLTKPERSALEQAIEPGFRLDWHASARDRWRFAKLSAMATDIRLQAPETFPVHQQIIDWDTPLSPTRIPAGALGLRRSTLWVMRWALQSWSRMRLLNRLGGSKTTSLEMDYAPIMCSSAVFTIRRKQDAAQPELAGTEERLEAGQALQRFWLIATKLGLAMQPALAVLIFAHFGQHDIAFTAEAKLREKAKRLAESFRRVLGASPDEFLFMGRVGEPRPKNSVIRSTRRSLAELIITPKA